MQTSPATVDLPMPPSCWRWGSVHIPTERCRASRHAPPSGIIGCRVYLRGKTERVESIIHPGGRDNEEEGFSRNTDRSATTTVSPSRYSDPMMSALTILFPQSGPDHPPSRCPWPCRLTPEELEA
jgi:hypothetical protein